MLHIDFNNEQRIESYHPKYPTLFMSRSHLPHPSESAAVFLRLGIHSREQTMLVVPCFYTFYSHFDVILLKRAIADADNIEIFSLGCSYFYWLTLFLLTFIHKLIDIVLCVQFTYFVYNPPQLSPVNVISSPKNSHITWYVCRVGARGSRITHTKNGIARLQRVRCLISKWMVIRAGRFTCYVKVCGASLKLVCIVWCLAATKVNWWPNYGGRYPFSAMKHNRMSFSDFGQVCFRHRPTLANRSDIETRRTPAHRRPLPAHLHPRTQYPSPRSFDEAGERDTSAVGVSRWCGAIM